MLTALDMDFHFPPPAFPTFKFRVQYIVMLKENSSSESKRVDRMMEITYS